MQSNNYNESIYKIVDTAYKTAQKYARLDIDKNIVLAVIMTESSGNENQSSGSAYGLMQLTEIAYKDVVRLHGEIYSWEKVKTNPVQNVVVGTLYLDRLYKHFKSKKFQLVYQVMSYNWGIGNVDKWLSEKRDNQSIDEAVPEETRAHLLDVLYWYYYFEQRGG